MFYTEVMARIGVRELNQQTSQILDRVRAGETIEITDRGIPIAEIRPIGGQRSGLARLIAEGRLAAATVDPAIVQSMSMVPQDDVNVADLLAADREEERW
jgi:prevent-host-death family protein